MKILCFYPSLDLRVDAIAEVPLAISKRGHEVLVLGSHSVNSLKGRYELPRDERHGTLRFFRPFTSYRQMRYSSRAVLEPIREEIRDFHPDIIFCSGEFNLRVARFFQKAEQSRRPPLVLLMEFLSADRIIYPRLKGYNALRACKMQWLFRFFRSIYLRRIARWIDALICVEYQPEASARAIFEKRHIPVCHIPWTAKARGTPSKKEALSGIHIGSLEAFKNAGEFLQTLPLILENSRTTRFEVIGPGPYAEDIRRLQQKYPGRLIYTESVPREEAEALIAKRCYGYTPVRAGGLGFIADCWAQRTALIATSSLNGYLQSGEDCLIADAPEKIAETVNRLLEDDMLRKKLEENGYQRYLHDHTPEHIADQYIDLFTSVLEEK